ncbi:MULTISPECIES: helix-turn-helix domain-containing protein [Burkholderia]|uniref:helix-turn-helix domain-containing protein n=1 Tax=Burkholderia TaxID=32008 RepID=UPI002445D62F|nr:helix-turn-helix transcriptional regulator [Burkholderia gladioli]
MSDLGERREFVVAIGRAIAARRKALGMTQEKLSEQADITQATLSNIERGAVMPGLDRLAQIAELLNCRLADLFTETGTAPMDRAIRICQKISRLNPAQQEALERMIDDAVAIADHAAPSKATKRRPRDRA